MSIKDIPEDETEDFQLKEISKYKKEIEIYQKKIKGYEILNTLFKESVDKCKNQEAIIKLMDDKMKDMGKKLQNNRNADVEPSNTQNFESDENDRINHTRSKETELVSDVLQCNMITFNKTEEDFRQPSMHSSSGSSFVKVTESQVGEDDLHVTFSVDSKDNGGAHVNDYGEDHDDDIIKTYDTFLDDKVMTMIEIKDGTTTLEAELTAMMRKLKVLDLSSENLECQRETLFTEISYLTERMFKFYGCSKAIQKILEKYEKENKNLRNQLNEGIKQGIGRQDDDKMEEKIGELVSCKQALLKMMTQKDEQLVQRGHQIKFLRSNLEKSKLSFNRISSCFQENTKKWQIEYNKLEEQLKRMKEQRNHEGEERSNLRSEVKHLRRELEKLKKLQQLHDRHDSSEIEVLRQQIVVYAEDFNNERRDREKAQALVEDLQKKFDDLSIKLSNLNYENMGLKEKYKEMLVEQQSNSSTRIYGTATTSSTSNGASSPPHDECWQCHWCTYINNAWISYCAACDRPKL